MNIYETDTFALAALSIAVGTGFATTRAVWTDTVTVASNQVVTGTTDLQVSTDNAVTLVRHPCHQRLILSG